LSSSSNNPSNFRALHPLSTAVTAKNPNAKLQLLINNT
jgi:hypothetical protein